jgi:pyruvate/2-oxoglutarate dehydrogenase complex dihydrolipoamide acyltransferase (E2) component
MTSKITPTDYAERWLSAGLEVCGRAGGMELLDVDMTLAAETMQRFKSHGTPFTWTHLFVRATAMVLERNPDLHKLVAGNSSLRPSTVDICLSLAGDSSVTPVLIIEDAARKGLLALAAEITRRTPDATAEAQKVFGFLRRFGWLVPFAFLRRALFRSLFRNPKFRRKLSGTFQVTCVRQVDIAAPFLFNTAAALGVGRVSDRVVAFQGRAVVRPTVTLCCCLDHSQWNGMAGAQFLAGLRDVLESGDFLEDPCSPRLARPQSLAAKTL